MQAYAREARQIDSLCRDFLTINDAKKSSRKLLISGD
jgi:hypothetical protein